MATLIKLRCFSSNENPSLYEQYLALKYQVFVVEQGWMQLADPSGKPIARGELYDDRGRICLASTVEGEPIGIVRGIALECGFPHRELLEQHVRGAEVREMLQFLCTFNALAVLPTHRRNEYEAVGLGWRGSVGRLLMLAIIQHMVIQGMKAAVATTGGIVPTRLCRSLGFSVIDAPTRCPHLHPEMEMTNIGMVFGSPAHARAQQECGMRPVEMRPLANDTARLLRYFEGRQEELLGAKVIEDLIYEPAVARKVT